MPIGTYTVCSAEYIAKQFESIGRNTAHQIRMKGRCECQATFERQSLCLFPSLVEILAVHHEFRTPGLHGVVLLDAVTFRHHHGDRHTDTTGRKRHALTMIAAGCGNESTVISLLLQASRIHESTADLEGACRRVIFMLYPDGVLRSTP